MEVVNKAGGREIYLKQIEFVLLTKNLVHRFFYVLELSFMISLFH